ncbi:MAG: galactitol-1-phosphate 5-dehydrogenase [Lachnospiraceae bacterium]|nr:galactitol-1-phosphate 5-dehydrogenase [Lachnospiraceae bacterium]
MKAWVLHGANDIRWELADKPAMGKGEVLVAVKAAGICGSDIPRIYKTGAHVHPLIPGHEFSGMVVGIGEGVDCAWQGKRVGIFPLIPCGKCKPCLEKQFEMCRQYDYLGSRRDGGFAEYVTVPVNNLIALPEGVTYEEAAMLEPMAVAVHAMRRVGPKKTETIAVCGLGTIGLLLLMFLLEDREDKEGIFAIGNKEFQKQQAVALGLPEASYCDSRKEDVGNWLQERTNGGADVFFECVGKNDTVVQAVNDTAPAGRICLVGNPASHMSLEKEVYWKILRNQQTIMGTWNSSFTGEETDDWHYVLERLVQNRVAPEGLISHKFSLEALEKGLRIMGDKSEDYVKIMACQEER